MWNAGLDELQAGIEIGGRNHLRYVDDTTIMAESKEELKSLFFCLFCFLFFFFNFYFYFILLYNTVLVLPYIDMNPSWWG